MLHLLVWRLMPMLSLRHLFWEACNLSNDPRQSSLTYPYCWSVEQILSKTGFVKKVDLAMLFDTGRNILFCVKHPSSRRSFVQTPTWCLFNWTHLKHLQHGCFLWRVGICGFVNVRQFISTITHAENTQYDFVVNTSSTRLRSKVKQACIYSNALVDYLHQQYGHLFTLTFNLIFTCIYSHCLAKWDQLCFIPVFHEYRLWPRLLQTRNRMPRVQFWLYE